jgi:hypothetical protein
VIDPSSDLALEKMRALSSLCLSQSEPFSAQDQVLALVGRRAHILITKGYSVTDVTDATDQTCMQEVQARGSGEWRILDTKGRKNIARLDWLRM